MDTKSSFAYMTNTFIPQGKAYDRNLKDQPGIISGADLYNKVSPVSKLTGRRENPLALLSKLANNPEYSRSLNALLQEIPALRSDPRLSDEDRIQFMYDRLATGTPAEDELMRQYLVDIADVLFKDSPQPSPVPDLVKNSDISFEPSDANVENV